MSEIISSPFTYAIIVAIAAFFAAYGSNRINNQRNKTAKLTENLVKTADSTLKELKEAGEKINLSLNETEKANLNLKTNNDAIVENLKKTIEAKETIIKVKDDILGMLTGGQSYPSILFNENGFWISITGEYGIPNLKLDIVHIKDYEKTPVNSLNKYLAEGYIDSNFKLVYSNTFIKTFAGTLHLLKFEDLNLDIDTSKSQGFDFIFNSNIKKWTQRIRLNLVNNRWEVLNGLEEEITYKESKNKIPSPKSIHFKVSKNFPHIREIGKKKIISTQAYYYLIAQRENQLKSSQLFNKGYEVTEEIMMESFSTSFFNF